MYHCGIYTKITSSGGRRYLQIVEGHRTDEGKVRHRVVANLGRMEDLTVQSRAEMVEPNQMEWPRCVSCGSADILRDAYACWDAERQERVLLSYYDLYRC